MVADIRRIRKSGRNTCCASRVSAKATSVVKLRSWNSSKITTETPSSPGSSTSRRTRTPSVSTSIRVPEDTFCSNRIRYPTVRPTGSPSIQAIRSAICRAATRRGSSISTFPSGKSSRMVSGSSVDLPAPGGAVTTATPRSRRAQFTSAATSPTGSASRNRGTKLIEYLPFTQITLVKKYQGKSHKFLQVKYLDAHYFSGTFFRTSFRYSQVRPTEAMFTRSSGECGYLTVGPTETISQFGYLAPSRAHSRPPWVAMIFIG